MNDYEARRRRRLERFLERAAAKRAEAAQLQKSAHERAEAIPFGQPILVGHHSERRDRNYRERIRRTYDRALEASQHAAELERRAEAAESNRAISSDDPEAVAKLKGRIAEQQAAQDRDKALNKLVRRNDRAALAGPPWNFSEATIARLFAPDFAGRIGIPSYVITNRAANIRRMQERIEQLSSRPAEATEETRDGITIIQNPDANRTQVLFPSKPAEPVRARLKAAGFRWSPTEGAWQRHMSNAALYAARYALGWTEGATEVTP